MLTSDASTLRRSEVYPFDAPTLRRFPNRAAFPASRRIIGFAFLAAALSACEEPAGLHVEPEAFEFAVLNRVIREPDTLHEQVEFTVIIVGVLQAENRDRITELAITWPNGIVKTDMLEALRASSVEPRAFRVVPHYPALVKGDYTLTVRFDDGQEVTNTLRFPGERITAVSVSGLSVAPSGVTVTWRPPSLLHEWSVRLERREPGPAQTVGFAHYGSFGNWAQPVTRSLAYDFQPGESYALVFELLSGFNHLTHVVPLTVSG